MLRATLETIDDSKNSIEQNIIPTGRHSTSLKVVDLAARYSVAPATVREWLRTEALKGLRIGRDWHVTWQACFTFEGCEPIGQSPRQLALARTRLLTPEELAMPLQHSADTILGWRRGGRLRGLVVGGRLVRFRCDMLERDLGRGLWMTLESHLIATAQKPCKATNSQRRKTTSR